MDQLRELADRYYAFASSDSPLGSMWDGKLEHLAEWDDFSLAAVEGRKAKYLAFAAEAETIDIGYDKYDVALRDTLVAEAGAAGRGLTWDAELFQVTPKMGMLEACLSFIGGYPLATAAHGEQYIAKLRGLPAALATLAAAAAEAASEGRVAAAHLLTETADSVDAYLATPVGPDERFNCQPAPTSLSDEDAAAWRAERDEVVATIVRPGLAAYGEAIRDLARRGRGDTQPGLCHVKDGDKLYRDHMRAHLGLDMDPHAIHQLGVGKIADLEDEYRAIAGPILGTTDIDEIYARLRDDQSLKYTSPEAIVADAEAALARAWEVAKDWFGTLPVSTCPAFATDYGPMAYYTAPDLETGNEAAFYFNTSNPSAWSTYELEAITFHEAIPGHHLQFALHAENPKLHKVQIDYFSTAYAEGWGLYTERLADEMGLYSSDLDRVGMLSADSLRACRLVVDTGMHALGWGREQAIQFMLDHTPMDRTHIEEEVDRYIALPGQALAYMIGRLEILDIRAEAEKLPGYTIKGFHDAVLAYGPVPLPTLRRFVLGD